jgi:hypothetical protein
MNTEDCQEKRPDPCGERQSSPVNHMIEPGGQASRGSLLVDLNGVVRFCSSSVTQLVGIHATDLVGKSVNWFLPDLPIRKETPGYNVAVTTVLFGDGGLPMRLTLANGSSKAVQTSVAHLNIDGSCMFSVELWWMPGPDA